MPVRRGAVKVSNRATKTKSGRNAVPPAPETARKAPKVMTDAAVVAEETLAKLEAEESLERARARGKIETKVLGGKLNWLQYLAPSDTRDIDACAEIDKYNHQVFEHNNAMLPGINELMSSIGREKMRSNPPTKYVPIARRKYEEMLFDKDFRVLSGIKFLAEHGVYPVRDFNMEEAPERADKMAEALHIAELIENAGNEGIDISAAAGSSHKNNCTCENRWDGVSERCLGEGVRVRWRTAKGHHFLRPRVAPETY